MEYKDIIESLVGIMLEAEEQCKIVKIIGDTDLLYDVAVELQDELGKNFYYECEEDDFDWLLQHTDILTISKTRDMYFLSETVCNGVTLENEADIFYIHENVFDRIDTDRLIGDIIVLKELDDSEDCDYTDSIENGIEEIFEDIVDDMLDELKETNEDEICTHCVLKEAVQRGYVEGYRKAQEMLRNALNENLEKMR